MSDENEREPWERLPREPSVAHDAFRAFRDLGPARRLRQVAEQLAVSVHSVNAWSGRWHWVDRAKAWDDHRYRIEDAERLADIAAMHRAHRLAGKLATARAIATLQRSDPAEIPPAVAVRLLELGTRLERTTLLTSVAELQGLDDETSDDDDPWTVIARELTGSA